MNWGFYAIESRGLAGGIIVIWRVGLANIDVFHQCIQHIVIVISERNKPTWLLSGIYASTQYRERQVMWNKVIQLVD